MMNRHIESCQPHILEEKSKAMLNLVEGKHVGHRGEQDGILPQWKQMVEGGNVLPVTQC